MSSIFHNSRRKGRRGRARKDGKLPGMTDAGIRMLARKDFEALSMAQLAREAGCSVGALYARFPNKNAFLYHLIGATFRSMGETIKLELAANRRGQLSASNQVNHVVDHIVSNMTSPRAAGVIRATMKLATVRPDTIQLFEDYRKTVSNLSVSLLSPKLSKTLPGAIRIAIQIVVATVTDAILQKQPGPMAAGSKRMKQALTNMTLGCLRVSGSGAGAGAGAEANGKDEPKAVKYYDDDALPGDEPRIFEPEMRAFRQAPKTAATKPAKVPQNALANQARANRCLR